MKFNIGDKVRYLNDIGGGIVTKYVDSQTVIIIDEDEFEIPVPVDDLILDQPFSYRDKPDEKENKQKNPDQNKKQVENKKDDFLAFYLAFVPLDQNKTTDSDLMVYLVNDSNYGVSCNLVFHYGAMCVSHVKDIEANTKLEIRKLPKTGLNDISEITVQAFFHHEKPHKPFPVLNKSIGFDPVKFFRPNSYTNSDFFEELSCIFEIYNESKSLNKESELKLKELKEAFIEKEIVNEEINKKPVSKTTRNEETWEIDLHIHELLDDTSGMSPKDMIDYQMDTFRKEMQIAISARIKKIIFIHGKGDGVLKTEIRKELKTNYRKYQFQDASFQQYGFGATAVYLR
ncbi:MAG: DUF2027 domain-containing protein [Bacteroidales bacterium]